MPRYKLTIEYDGTDFSGWQRQDGLPTVQAAVEAAVKSFCGREITVHCSGRTDSGVHAIGQVAHIDLPKVYESFQIRNALNHYLKDVAIVIIQVEEVDDSFHARFSSLERTYRYCIINQPSPLALDKLRAWHVVKPLDCEKMQQAANLLVGHHDFTTFRATECQANSPFKTLEQLDIVRNDNRIEIIAKSRSFLHHQVRNMAGTLKLVGEGKWSVDDMKQALEARDRRAGGPTAPAHGLYFVGVKYS